MSEAYSDIAPELRTVKIKPVAAAKLLGVPPQYVYNWIKKQGAPFYESLTGPMVILNELISWRSEHNKTARPGRPKQEDGSDPVAMKRTGLRDGAIVGYPLKPKGGIRLSQLELKKIEQGGIERKRGITFLTFWTEKGEVRDFYLDHVLESLKKGEIKIFSAPNTLRMVIHQLEIDESPTTEIVSAIGKLREALELLDKTGYNVSRGDEVLVEEPSPEPVAEGDVEDEVGSEEA